MSIETTLATLKNSAQYTSTPLILFIPQASQVGIFKNNQLIFSEYLNAGYQTIDTSNFPDGGYDITIKIGANQYSHQFFNKGFALPPIQAPQYYVLAGYLTNEMIFNSTYNYLPKTINPVVQTGISKRLLSHLALFSDLLLNNNQAYLDMGTAFFWRHSFIKYAALVSSRNNYGAYALINTQNNRLNFSITASKIFYQKQASNYFLDNLQDNDSASISYMISARDLIRFNLNYTKLYTQPESYNGGIFYQRLLTNIAGMGFFFNANYNRSIHTGSSYALGISMQFSKGTLAGTENVSWQNQANEHYYNNIAKPLLLQGSTVYSHQNNMGAGYALNESHTVSTTSTSLAGIYNYTSPKTYLSSYINYDRLKYTNPIWAYGGTLETELALNKNGLYFNGIDRSNSAGILIRANLNRNDPNIKLVRFALLDSNNHRVAEFPANKSTFVSLPGFTDEQYTLVNISKSEYHISKATQRIILYPGNVSHYVWQVHRRIIVIGRVIHHDHRNSLANAWIHHANNGIFTDNEGYFQLELAENIKQLVVDGSPNCTINLPALNTKQSYVYIGDSPCY